MDKITNAKVQLPQQITPQKEEISPKTEIKPPYEQSTIPFNNSYATAFLTKPQYTPAEQNFVKVRDEFMEKVSEKNKACAQAEWDFYIDSTDENADKLEKSKDEARDLYKDKETYEKFKAIDKESIKDKHLQKHYKDITTEFDDMFANADAIKALSDKEDEISKKYNSYVPKIDGKPTSKAELNKILQNSEDAELRKKAYDAKVEGGDLIADDLVELIKMRNDYAKTQGYDNYFSYMLKEKFEVDEKQLFNLLDDLNEKTTDAYNKVKDETDTKLSKVFGIPKEDLKPHHKGLLTEGSPVKEANDYVKTEDLVPFAKNMYKNMGWNIDEMPITLDLFPRENKNTHGFCFGIEAEKDARILANLTDDIDSMDTLHHELGHAVYTLGIPQSLPKIDQNEASSATTEAVAMLMGSLIQREDAMEKGLNVPKDLVERLDKERLEGLVKFVKTYVGYINFEKQLYENPNQDIKQLWFDTKKKYNNDNPPEVLNNDWATVPHFLSHPAYLQNYLRAEIMASQIYDAATSELGGPLTQNPKTAEFFKEKIFKHGAEMDENEIILNATGKELSAEAFCKQLEKLS